MTELDGQLSLAAPQWANISQAIATKSNDIGPDPGLVVCVAALTRS